MCFRSTCAAGSVKRALHEEGVSLDFKLSTSVCAHLRAAGLLTRVPALVSSVAHGQVHQRSRIDRGAPGQHTPARVRICASTSAALTATSLCSLQAARSSEVPGSADIARALRPGLRPTVLRRHHPECLERSYPEGHVISRRRLHLSKEMPSPEGEGFRVRAPHPRA